MRELEETLREGLARLADETATGVPLAQQARAARRRRTRRLALTAAVAVVLVVAASAGVTLRTDGGDGGPSVATRAGGPTQQPAPAGYRLEVWQDVGVYVPTTWGWGGAPGACGVGPTVGPDGHRLSAAERTGGVLQGYVGRPVDQTQRCPKSTSQGGGTDLSFVWLGAEVTSGSSDHGAGFVVDTRRVGDTTVSVGSTNADLRRTILASAHRLPAGPCPDWLASPPSPGQRPAVQPAAAAPDSLTVCAYGPATMSGYDLRYQQALGAGPAKQLADAVAQAAPMGEFSCFGASGGEWALLHLTAAGGSSDYVVDLSCPSIADPAGQQHRLTSADVLPWAVDGINAVLHGSPLIDVPGRLIGQ
jgi:hypothetical protein